MIILQVTSAQGGRVGLGYGGPDVRSIARPGFSRAPSQWSGFTTSEGARPSEATAQGADGVP